MPPCTVHNLDRENSMQPETLRMVDTVIRQQIQNTIAIRRAHAGWQPWLAVAMVYAVAFAVIRWVA